MMISATLFALSVHYWDPSKMFCQSLAPSVLQLLKQLFQNKTTKKTLWFPRFTTYLITVLLKGRNCGLANKKQQHINKIIAAARNSGHEKQNAIIWCFT